MMRPIPLRRLQHLLKKLKLQKPMQKHPRQLQRHLKLMRKHPRMQLKLLKPILLILPQRLLHQHQKLQNQKPKQRLPKQIQKHLKQVQQVLLRMRITRHLLLALQKPMRQIQHQVQLAQHRRQVLQNQMRQHPQIMPRNQPTWLKCTHSKQRIQIYQI